MAKLISFIQTQSIRFLYFVNHLSKNQLAALSTFFSLGFLSLILLNLHLYPNASRPDQGIEILVELKSEALTFKRGENETRGAPWDYRSL